MTSNRSRIFFHEARYKQFVRRNWKTGFVMSMATSVLFFMYMTSPSAPVSVGGGVVRTPESTRRAYDTESPAPQVALGIGDAGAADAADRAPVPQLTRTDDPTALASLMRRNDLTLVFRDEADLLLARGTRAALGLADPNEAATALGTTVEQAQQGGRSFIRYDPRTLESRLVGDDFDLLVPQMGIAVKGVIDNVERVGDAWRWSGTLPDIQGGGRFSITHAARDQYAVGSIDTPVGSFSLESRRSYGWVADQSKDFHIPTGGDALADNP